MAYMYGLLLVLLIVRRDGLLHLVRSVVLAAVTGVVFLICLAAWFGLESVVHTLLLVRGSESYKLLNYGFVFGIGWRFWLPEGVTPRYYLFSPTGQYLAGSIVLIVGAAASFWQLLRKSASEGGIYAELIACCGVMHLSFLALFYADFASWTYY